MDYFDARDDPLCLCKEEEIGDDSPILDFYADKTIFITGGSGFFGKVLLEKLLRTCSNVRKIHVLLRPKRGKSSKQRLVELFEDLLFERMKQEQPEFLSKVELIEGDCAKERIGLSDEDYKKLIEEVNIVFHAAAALRMDEHLRTAYYTNVRATKFILEMTRNMPNFKSMIHFSTAYSHGYRCNFQEKFYPVNLTPEEIETLLDVFDDWQIGAISTLVAGKWMNTYAYTKAVAENIVESYIKEYNLPLAVARPSIVVSTSSDPIKAWINNVYGATGVLAGAALGVLHTMYCDSNKLADLIPVDYVIHASIAAAWEIANHKRNPSAEPVYNLVSTHYHKNLTWSKFMRDNEMAAKYHDLSSMSAIWAYSFRLDSSRFVYEFNSFFMHLIPALFFDAYLRLTGKQPLLVKSYRKIINFVGFFFPYANKEWDFTSQNVSDLWSRLTSKERHLFMFDIKAVDWDNFFVWYMRGLRLYVINESYSLLPAARKRSKRLEFCHKLLCGALHCFRIYLLYIVTKCIYTLVKKRYFQ